MIVNMKVISSEDSIRYTGKISEDSIRYTGKISEDFNIKGRIMRTQQDKKGELNKNSMWLRAFINQVNVNTTLVGKSSPSCVRIHVYAKNNVPRFKSPQVYSSPVLTRFSPAPSRFFL